MHTIATCIRYSVGWGLNMILYINSGFALTFLPCWSFHIEFPKLMIVGLVAALSTDAYEPAHLVTVQRCPILVPCGRRG